MIGSALLLSLIGGLVLLDKQAIGEFGISQPIVACPLLGLIFGDFNIGLLLGGVLQLVWIGSLPLGAKEPLDNQGAGVVAMSIFILAKNISLNTPHEKIIFVSFLFAGIASIIGQVLSQILKKTNNYLFNRVNKDSSDKLIISTHLSGVVTALLRGFVLIIIFLILFILIAPLIKLLPNFRLGELLVLPLAIGLAGIARLVIIKRQLLYSILGVVTGLALWVLLK